MPEIDDFSKAYDDYADAIFRHCYFRVFDRERARELMQDTFMKTWRYISQGNDVQNMKAFLYKVATNLIINESRNKKAVSLEDLQAEGFDIADNEDRKITSGAEAQLLMKLLDKLDSDSKELIVMRYIEDIKPEEIARIMNVTANAISVRLHRAVKKAQDLMSREMAKADSIK